MPGLWSEDNLPTPLGMLNIIQAVCAYPAIASNKALVNGTPNGVVFEESHLKTLANGIASTGDKENRLEITNGFASTKDYQTTNGVSSEENHLETLVNGITFTGDAPSNGHIISKESSLVSNCNGHSNNHSNPTSSIASASASSISITSISDTPPNVPNPTFHKLQNLIVGLNFYNFYSHDHPYFPLPPLGATDYTLSIQPIYPQSLNSDPLSPGYYHHLLRLTRLHYASSTTTLRTVALGRILYLEKPTYWIVVMDIQHGNLYALRSDTVALEELLVESDDQRDNIDWKTIPAAELPEFDNKSWKAVLLGDTTILDGNRIVGGDTAKGGYQALIVEDWDSVTVDGRV
ncbi:uncharacterized protein LY89DRAFT_667276 [Mollisia scopiformis]|uniref:Uncharacterized protein n=1 Tax=Mollisia scopiformis TaxID=149040 RepID=A0A194XGH8_MOLSC|nr:uncharacterized protein LY89DRAFT_667276 [Mollisia scopiformis]KUJ19300.1 hypothetical protein LY89DRAFT_667276 [Mollisia scopiformis]